MWHQRLLVHRLVTQQHSAHGVGLAKKNTFQHTSHLVTARVKLDQCLEQHVCDIFVLLAYTDADSAHLS